MAAPAVGALVRSLGSGLVKNSAKKIAADKVFGRDNKGRGRTKNKRKKTCQRIRNSLRL